MVSFSITETQQMLRDLAHDFAAEHVRPKSEEWDQSSEYPMDAIAAAHEAGLMNLHIPEAYGGMAAWLPNTALCQCWLQ